MGTNPTVARVDMRPATTMKAVMGTWATFLLLAQPPRRGVVDHLATQGHRDNSAYPTSPREACRRRHISLIA